MNKKLHKTIILQEFIGHLMNHIHSLSLSALNRTTQIQIPSHNLDSFHYRTRFPASMTLPRHVFPQSHFERMLETKTHRPCASVFPLRITPSHSFPSCGLGPTLIKLPNPQHEVANQNIQQSPQEERAPINTEFAEFPEDSRIRKCASCIPVIGLFVGHMNEHSLLLKIHKLSHIDNLLTATTVKNNYKLTAIVRTLLSTAIVISQMIIPYFSAPFATYAIGLTSVTTVGLIAKKYYDFVLNTWEIIFHDTKGFNKQNIL